MGDGSTENGQVLYLSRAEGALFGRFVSEVNAGEYDRASKIIDLLERLSII